MDEEIISNDFDTEKAVINKNLYSEVNNIINSLNSKFRIPLILHYNTELSVDEIVKICNCPIGTVKSRLHKARELVKKELEGLGYGSNEWWKTGNVIKSSLKDGSEPLPSDELNIGLKRALRLKAKRKAVSLWYLPLIAALLISLCISSFVILFILSALIQALVLGSLAFSLINISILTYIGVKKFELKEGAILELWI